uniref:Iodothyronine deiodinase n=1 Tax=Oryzias latipes TaxID=8090 RepID=A0A3P9ING5_ORYLA
MGLREKSWRVLQHLGVCLRAAGMLCCLLTLNVTLRVLRFISPALVRKLLLKMGEKISMTHNPRFRYEDWGPTFLSAVFIKEAIANICRSIKQEAFVGGVAPDSPVITMGAERTSILSFMKGGRPLVLSFGSCS